MPPLPKIRGTQIGLRRPELVDRLKFEMRAGTFRFASPEGRVGGVLDKQGVYHVMEGHHRVVAALELLAETGDDYFIKELIARGIWDQAPTPPGSRPLPSRFWLGRMRNRLGF